MISDEKSLENLLIDIDILHELDKYIKDINIFDILKIANAELKHSIVLAYIFNPNENHNLGSIPLELFFKKISSNAQINQSFKDCIISGIDYSDFNVIREYKNIDILIKSNKNKIVICIENKIGTSEHDNQLNRYREIIDTEFKNYTKVYLYLTPNGYEASDNNNWTNISYKDILDVIEKINLEAISSKVKMLIEDYKKIIRRMVMNDYELKELCNKIYRKHKQAFDLIYENKEDDTYYLYSIINEYLKKKNDENLIIYDEKYSSSKTLRFTTTALEKVFPLIEDTENSFWKNGWTCCYAVEVRQDRVFCELYFSNYFVDKEAQYSRIMDYLDKMQLKPYQNAWKNGYHLNVRYLSIEITDEDVYNIETAKNKIYKELDKILLPILEKEKDIYDKN